MTTKHTKMCPTELHIGENTIKVAMKCLGKPCENSSHCFFSSQQTWAKKIMQLSEPLPIAFDGGCAELSSHDEKCMSIPSKIKLATTLC